MARDRAAKPARGGRLGSLLWLAGLGCGALVTLATPTAVLAGCLLAPGLLSLLVDQVPGKPTARSVMLFGLAATVQPMASLWRTGHQIGTALDMAAAVSVLGTAWVAQGGAWMLCELAPVILALAMEALSQARAARLRTERTGHQEQWGLPPPG
jgi:uncharacterized oligopeptide transporter (OPT) family protein